MFYAIFSNLCSKKGVKPANVAESIGISKSAITKWKNGSLPNSDTLKKLSDYFEVSIDFLTGKETETSKKNYDYFVEKMFGYSTRLNEKEKQMLLDMATYMDETKKGQN